MRTVSVTEPFVLVNKLPVPLTYRVINRSGLDLVYVIAADSEAYIPPPAARTRVGNAQISAYSSDNSGKIPVIRQNTEE
ncbi:hypothetical protein PsorP6_000214 [Peronosclerospora sorghi]|uniref:Uncharacterized protein n=1 Tax=Peronosclerospora sorghi TaxID=230839 RepID=A0ACC0WS68_9STRA|nr:hypothetical protein PsorP6_000214 [Peronosclerospora sorghi]